MAKNSIKDRIQITKNGKVRRRAMGLAHAKTSKSKTQLRRRIKKRGLDVKVSTVKNLLDK